MSAPQRVEHFFRHEYGRLVATLAQRVGVEHIEAVEDAAQSALMKALDTWPASGRPENPSAWLFRVAKNELLGDLRKRVDRDRILELNAGDVSGAIGFSPEVPPAIDEESELLRMLFVACDPLLPPETQLVFALKVLCGFSVGEIATRLFTSDANVYKRLTRARARLKENPPGGEKLDDGEYALRLSAVHKVLYLLFTEGHLSSHNDYAIRKELCEEAIRLALLLVEHPAGQVPETYALLALMHLHDARAAARQDGAGGLLLLEEQDRSLWDRERTHTGLRWLAKSAEGDAFSRYHAEAGIAAEHCLAPSFAETRWDRVADCYAMLEQLAPSPVYRLNRAVAMAEWRGPAAGLALLAESEAPEWFTQSYQWAAVLADLHRRSGDAQEASHYRVQALAAAPTAAIRQVLERRLG